MVYVQDIYCTWEIVSTGQFWWTIQVKAIGEEKIAEWTKVSAYAKYIFGVSANIGELLTACQIHQLFFPTKIFL